MKKICLSLALFSSFFIFSQDLATSFNQLKESFKKLSNALEGKETPAITGEIPVVFIFGPGSETFLNAPGPSNLDVLKNNIINELKNLNSRIAFKDYTYDEFMANPVSSSDGIIVNIFRVATRIYNDITSDKINQIIEKFDNPINVFIGFIPPAKASFDGFTDGNLDGKLTKDAKNFLFYLPYKTKFPARGFEFPSLKISYDFGNNDNLLKELGPLLQSIA